MSKKAQACEVDHGVGRSGFPLWAVFALIFAAEVLLHLTLLRLPYYWDEGGYYIPAAWDFWRLGTLIPQTTMSNAHPPLPSILLAAWWKLTGFHILSTRLFLCLVTSIALTGVFRMVRCVAGQQAATAVLLLTAVYPVWFAQSTLAHADMFAAAATLWALAFYFEPPQWSAPISHRVVRRGACVGLCFSLAVLSKETAIVLPAALFCLEAWWWLQERLKTVPELRPQEAGQKNGILLLGLAAPVFPLVAWYAYHRAKTGFTFGNPEYLRYNATANLSAARVLLSLWHRLIHLTVHMELFVPVLLALGALTLLPRPGRPKLPQRFITACVVLLAVQWIAFSILGGALLTRYLLPAYPLLLLLCVHAWQRRVVRWHWFTALSLGAFAVGCNVNPPYPFAPEDNLAYRDMIVLHQQAIREVTLRYPGATVLSAWPVTADIQRPELGYTSQPLHTTQIDNFTPQEIAKAAEHPDAYDVAIVFSTKYNPPASGLVKMQEPSASDIRYFDAHRDMMPAEIARVLGGDVVWQTQHQGQWAAVLHFNRGYNVMLFPGL